MITSCTKHIGREIQRDVGEEGDVQVRGRERVRESEAPVIRCREVAEL